jgi:hypothetical protein
MEAWQTERQETEQQHKHQLEELSKVRMQDAECVPLHSMKLQVACVRCRSVISKVSASHVCDRNCCCPCVTQELVTASAAAAKLVETDR